MQPKNVYVPEMEGRGGNRLYNQFPDFVRLFDPEVDSNFLHDFKKSLYDDISGSADFIGNLNSNAEKFINKYKLKFKKEKRKKIQWIFKLINSCRSMTFRFYLQGYNPRYGDYFVFEFIIFGFGIMINIKRKGT